MDDILLPLFEKIKDRVNIEKLFVTSFGGETVSHNYEDYEQVLQGTQTPPSRVELNENDALGMCYTSGTTGKPKGVVYSHRAIALHSYSISLLTTSQFRAMTRSSPQCRCFTPTPGVCPSLR